MTELGFGRRELLAKTGMVAALATLGTGCDTAELKRTIGQAVMGTPGEMLMDGSAWEFFCDTLKNAGDEIIRDSVPGDELTRAEGFRYLIRLLGLGADMLMEYKTPENPAFFKLQGSHRKYAGDNPDQYYDTAIIDGRYTYKVTGTMRDTLLIEAGIYAGSFSGDNQTRRLVAYRDETEITLNENGDFELILSSTPQDGDWVKIEPDADAFLIRRYFADPLSKQEQPLIIERIDMKAPTPQLTAEAAGFGLLGAAKFVEGNSRVWREWVEDIRARKTNVLEQMVDTGDIQTPDGVDYLQGYWQLAEDEALVVRFRAPDVPYWGFLIMNFWMESLDFQNEQVTLNNHQAIVGEDGMVEIIIAHRDPGRPNWLHTTGHREGTMSLRVARLQGEMPKASVELIKL
ncbi:MAG: DUF1214 domain-containing protein [Halioglobus sp.]